MNNSDYQYTAGQVALSLPEGLSLVSTEDGSPVVEKGNRLATTNHTIGASRLSNGLYQFTIFSISSEVIPQSEGELFSVTLIADNNLEVGTTLEAKFVNIELSTTNAQSVPFNDIAFSVTIAAPEDPWITLDENSLSLPDATDEATLIKVIRTINANQWSTICLPFSMTSEQVYEAFGKDVELVEFIDYEVSDDETSISVNFESAYLEEDGFFANYPYLIKTTKDIKEFMVTAVIEPDEENAIAEFTNGKGGSRKEIYGTFYGTLKAGTVLPNNYLFLNNEKFWYSAGKTSILGFRGYFNFVDILPAQESASKLMNLNIKSAVTGIESVVNEYSNTLIYDLQGRNIAHPTKGIYIKNGKKYLIK